MSTCSFTWKRKAGQDVCKTTVKRFEANQVEDAVMTRELSGEELLHWQPKQTANAPALEDSRTKASRLSYEGCVLAENDRLWEAIRKWDEAIQLTPTDARLHEMKAQALTEVQEILGAVQEADLAVKLKPNWWVAHQTLGRAQLGLGEVQLAIRSFSRACHLNPDENELWEGDLKWARSLMEQATANALTSVSLQLQKSPNGDQDSEAGVTKLSKNSWIRMRTS